MRTAIRRIDKLENRLGIAAGKPELFFVASAAGRRQALDVDTCVEILRECGFLPRGPGIGLVNLLNLPEDLNGQELERFLCEHGPEICGARSVNKP